MTMPEGGNVATLVPIVDEFVVTEDVNISRIK